MKDCLAWMGSLVLAGCGAVGTPTGTGGTAGSGPTLSLLAGPPEINGANGMRFDAQGQLYVGSVNDGKLYRIDPDTGQTLAALGAESGVQSPDDLTIAEDGTIYVANILQGTIVALKDGQHREVVNLGAGVDGIASSPSGTLIIGMDFFADGLYEVDPAGGVPPRTVSAQPGWINAMAFGASGTLYAPVWQKKYVARVNLASGAITQFSKPFAGTAGAVRFDATGALYAVDGGVGDVHRIDLLTGNLSPLLHYGMPLDNLAFDANNRLFISSYADGSVHEVLLNGSLRVLKAPGLLAPVALAVASDAAESVYVGDVYGVHEFDGLASAHRGGFGSGLALSSPRLKPLALRAAGSQLLALGPNSLEVWDRSTGSVQSSTLVSGGEDVVAFQAGALVSQPSQGAVVALASGSAAAFASGLGDPAGLAANALDAFVSVYSAGEVRQIAAAGRPLVPPRTVASGLAWPEGIALLPDGNIAIVETGTGNVVRVDPSTGNKTILAERLSPGAPAGSQAALGSLNAIAVGASGQLYVLSPVDHKVWRVRF